MAAVAKGVGCRTAAAAANAAALYTPRAATAAAAALPLVKATPLSAAAEKWLLTWILSI